MDILYVDDEPQGREAVAAHIERLLGHRIIQCDDGLQALECYRSQTFPMVLTDIRMPRLDGIELLRRIKDLPEGGRTDVVLITAHGDMSTAIAALRAGAYDYLQKPIEIEELVAVIDRVAEHQTLLRENRVLTEHFEEKVAEVVRQTTDYLKQTCLCEVAGLGQIGVFSDRMKELLVLARRYGQDRSMPVLIEGETGTGKEIIARIIHHAGGAADAPFVAINCPAISAGLFESELFGYESGAFTGARKAGQLGKFEFAAGGTVFLDEIGDLPLEMQPKLLRVLQERTFYRVGGLRRVELKAKVICATNQSLEALVRQGQFREDLFYRLNIGKISIPPLRERPEEILPLARMFLARAANARKRAFRDLGERTEALLPGYAWPGNVRELKNAIERAVLLYDGPRLEPEHLAFERSGQRVDTAAAASSGDGALVIPLSGAHLDIDQVEAQVLKEVLAKFNGNKSQAAAFLGITPSSLRRKLKRLSVPDSF